MDRPFSWPTAGRGAEAVARSVAEYVEQVQQLVLFPVHPATISWLRAALYPSGAKDDPKDADLVLDMLVYHRERLRPLVPDTVATRQLLFLVEQRRSLVDQRTDQSNRLKSTLKQYYPQILDWFDDPAAPLVAALLSRWPTVEMLQKARGETLVLLSRAQLPQPGINRPTLGADARSRPSDARPSWADQSSQVGFGPA